MRERGPKRQNAKPKSQLPDRGPRFLLAPAKALRLRLRDGLGKPVGNISAKCCSFSAVSAPIFATKYAFCSIFQNLPDYLTEFIEIRQNFAYSAKFAKNLLNFYDNC